MERKFSVTKTYFIIPVDTLIDVAQSWILCYTQKYILVYVCLMLLFAKLQNNNMFWLLWNHNTKVHHWYLHLFLWLSLEWAKQYAFPPPCLF